VVTVGAGGGLVRSPGAGRGLIAKDFDFCGILTANKLSEFRHHKPGRRAVGTIRTEWTPLRRASGATTLYFGFELRIHAKTVGALWQRGQL
jgi:hypothetical protein